MNCDWCGQDLTDDYDPSEHECDMWDLRGRVEKLEDRITELNSLKRRKYRESVNVGNIIEDKHKQIEQLEGIAHRPKGENMEMAKSNEKLQQKYDSAEYYSEQLQARLDMLGGDE